MHMLTRREALKAGTLSAAALAMAVAPRLLARTPVTPLLQPPKRTLRIAHLTDIHVQPELHAGEGLSACLRHTNSLADKPDLIITGGDQVMDTFGQRRDRTTVQWDLWKSCLAGDNSIPIDHTLGNHDIWGWNKAKSGTTGDEADYGKKMALEHFGRPKTYKSMDKGGWHIIILDSIQPEGDGYIGRLDEEQFAWLEQDLASTPDATPVVLFSHIPIFSVCVYNDGAVDKKAPNAWKVPGAQMHIDAHRIRSLFLKHPNVKLCISGHIHQRDCVEFNDVTYVCDGAVSGSWWKGRNAECDEGYGLFNFYDNGTFDHAYQTYGWVAKK